MGPCAEGTKTPSVVPGGIRAEGRHTQSAPGHKAEVIARVLAARPPLHPTWAHDMMGRGGKRRLGTITLKKEFEFNEFNVVCRRGDPPASPEQFRMIYICYYEGSFGLIFDASALIANRAGL